MTEQVSLNVYDLSQGMARQFSPMFLGRQIDGVWHTGIVFRNREYYFGGGIQTDPVGYTPYGRPVETIDLGRTSKTADELRAFLRSISHKYTAETYSLLRNNCNNFSDDVARFLVGRGIPEHITGLPAEVMNTPLGAMFAPMIEQMEASFTGRASEFGLGAAATPAPASGGAFPGEGQTTGAAAASDVVLEPTSLFRGSVPVRKIADRLRKSADASGLAALDVAERVLCADADSPTVGDGELASCVDGLVVLVGQLPATGVFACLDLLRLLALDERPHAALLQADPMRVFGAMRGWPEVASDDVTLPTRMMAARLACNLFAFPAGRTWAGSEAVGSALLDFAMAAFDHADAETRLRTACASLIRNVSGASEAQGDVAVRCVSSACFHVADEADDGVLLAVLQALDDAAERDAASVELMVSMDLDVAPLAAGRASAAVRTVAARLAERIMYA